MGEALDALRAAAVTNRRQGRLRWLTPWAAALAGITIVMVTIAAFQPRRAPNIVHAIVNDGPPYYGSWVSPNIEARASFERGMAAFDEADLEVAYGELKRARSLDPDFAAAYLRVALANAQDPGGEERASFEQLFVRRDHLGVHDRALLNAIEPLYRIPRNDAEWRSRFARLSADNDPDFATQRCMLLIAQPAFAEAVEACREVTRLTPDRPAAYDLESNALRGDGDLSASEDSLLSCLARWPNQPQCTVSLSEVVAIEGRCDEAASIAERAVAGSQTFGPALERYAWTLFAAEARSGSGFDGYRKSLDHVIAHAKQSLASSADFVRLHQATSDLCIDAQEGRFEDAIRIVDDVTPFVDNQDETALAIWFNPRLELLRELGREGEAASYARSLLDKQKASVPGSVDSTMFVLSSLYADHRLARSTFVAERRKWLEDPARSGATYPPRAWVEAYGIGIASESDAREALAAVPRFAPFPKPGARPDIDFQLGWALLRARRFDESIVSLRAVARSCEPQFLTDVHAAAALGDALAATGDSSGACDAYAFVLGRWGRSVHSVTARHARAESARLRCANVP